MEFTTYRRGTKVINYILVARNIMGYMQSVGYEPFCFHIFSNHQGIFLGVATAQCFGSNIQPLLPIHLCNFSTKRTHQVAPYFQAKQKHLEHHKWFTKIKEITRHMKQGIPNHALAEDLYKHLMSASRHSRSKLKKFPQPHTLPP